MTGTDLEVRPQQQVTLDVDQLQYIANTQFVKDGIRGNLPAILATVAYGRALGLPDMIALSHVVMIDGKPTLEAAAMNALARQRGHSIQGEVTEGKARVVGVRADNGDTMTVEWTLAMAERAGLLGKQNWRKYPEAMLWARAVSQLCRELFADVFAGATYTPEELGDDSEAADPTSRTGDTPPLKWAQGKASESVGEPQADRSSSFLSSDTVSAPVGGEAPSPTVQASAGSALDPTAADPAEEILGEPTKRKIKDADRLLDKDVDEDRPMWRKLNTLIGRHTNGLDDAAASAFKKRLYATMAQQRVRKTDALILELGGIGEDGFVHWSPLRDSLTRGEAHLLIDKLEALEK